MRAFAAILLSVFFALTAQGKSYDIDKSNSEVSFLAVGNPGFLQIEGEGGWAKGSLSVENRVASGELKCDLSHLTTGLALRDRHMRNTYLETKTHSEATFKFSGVKVRSAGKFPIAGDLTLHGVTKAVKGEAQVKTSGGQRVVEVTLKLNLEDFNIAIPSYKEVTVAKDVTTTIRLKI